jgi:small-conductance mechanosensitive channel
MNVREELLQLLKQASTALAKTQAELEEAKRVVAEWATLPTTHKEHWVNATLKFKRKTIEEWEQEVAELKEKEKMLVQREKEARASFNNVVQGNSFSNSIGVESISLY